MEVIAFTNNDVFNYFASIQFYVNASMMIPIAVLAILKN